MLSQYIVKVSLVLDYFHLLYPDTESMYFIRSWYIGYLSVYNLNGHTVVYTHMVCIYIYTLWYINQM